MKETREFCDCCRVEFDLGKDGTVVYRKRVRRFYKPWWPRFSEVEASWEVVCEDCWRAVGIAVTERRESEAA